MKNRETENYDDVMKIRDTVSVRDVNPFIRGLKGEYDGYDIPVLKTGILLGRDPAACQLIFANTPSVSRYHCRVSYNARTGYFIITDLNSTNGIFMEDGSRLEKGGKLALIPGQIFKMCQDDIIFQVITKRTEF